MAADIRRIVAHGTRLVLRAVDARPRLGGDEGEIREDAGARHLPAGRAVRHRRADRRAQHVAHLRLRRRHPAHGRACRRRPPRRRLRNRSREQFVSLQEDLRRRGLERRRAPASRRRRHPRRSGRLSAEGERAGGHGGPQRLFLFHRPRGQGRRAHGQRQADGAGSAHGDGETGGKRVHSALHGLGRRKQTSSSRRNREARSATSISPTRTRARRRSSPATSTRRRRRKGSSSTGASTAAGSIPTFSSSVSPRSRSCTGRGATRTTTSRRGSARARISRA